MEAVVMQQQARGVEGVSADHVFMGNGVSELIDLTLRGLLNPGDEVLIPSPDYSLWTAATVLNGGKAIHYPCPESQGFNPDPAAVAKLITPRTCALVVINPVLAITFTRPPQRAHCSISIPNTRLRRR